MIIAASAFPTGDLAHNPPRLSSWLAQIAEAHVFYRTLGSTRTNYLKTRSLYSD